MRRTVSYAAISLPLRKQGKKVVATEDHKKRMADMGLTIRYMDPAQYAKYWIENEAMIKELLPLTQEWQERSRNFA